MGIFDSIKKLFKGDTEETDKSFSYTDANSSEDPISKSLETPNDKKEVEFADKAKEFLSGTIDEVKEQGSSLWNEVKEKAADLDEATKEYREKLAQKAKDAIESIDQFVDETVEKAQKFADQESKKDVDQDGISDKPIDFGKDLSDKHETFFSKAEDWLKKNDSDTPVDGFAKSDSQTKQKEILPVELPPDPEPKN